MLSTAAPYSQSMRDCEIESESKTRAHIQTQFKYPTFWQWLPDANISQYESDLKLGCVVVTISQLCIMFEEKNWSLFALWILREYFDYGCTYCLHLIRLRENCVHFY